MKRDLIKQEKEAVLKRFFRTQLDFNEQIIDNSDGAIAKYLGLPKHRVTRAIREHLEEKQKKRDEKK